MEETKRIQSKLPTVYNTQEISLRQVLYFPTEYVNSIRADVLNLPVGVEYEKHSIGQLGDENICPFLALCELVHLVLATGLRIRRGSLRRGECHESEGNVVVNVEDDIRVVRQNGVEPSMVILRAQY